MTATRKPIAQFMEEYRTSLKTPYYLIDEAALVNNLEKIALLRQRSGTKSVLALKCFSTWGVFDLMREYLDGTTASSLYEARLGHEKFGKEVHAYSVAFSDDEVKAVRPLATKLIFNSVTQLMRFYPHVRGTVLGLRVNPGVSYSRYDLADPARKYSRLGATDLHAIEQVSSMVTGLMFHCNCENDRFAQFNSILDHIESTFGGVLKRMDWVSLGGGIAFTNDDYAFNAFCERLSDLARRFQVQVYLEPGEAAVSGAGYLVTQVLDIVHNEMDVAIVDAGVETHMLDLLTYGMEAKLALSQREGHRYILAGRTCLAGDVFGTFSFAERLSVGSLVPFAEAASYTLVKKNWFNGISMPSIVIWRLDGRVDVIKDFSYEDFVASLS